MKSTSHSRDRSSPLDAMQSALDERLGYEATAFLCVIRTEISPYARDQFMLLNALSDQYGEGKILTAIRFCEDTRLVSATYVRDYLKHGQQPHPPLASLTIPVSDSKYHVVTQKRSLSVYAKAGDSK